MNETRQLKKVIKTTYKVMYWISLFLLLPTITLYIIPSEETIHTIIKTARNIGILITYLYLLKITKAMKKKEKQQKKEEEIKKDEKKNNTRKTNN